VLLFSDEDLELLSFSKFIHSIARQADLPLARSIANQALIHFKDTPALVNEIYSPLPHEGQILKALYNANYATWGRLYLPMLASAHRNQECCNFKDLSVQNYGGELFRSLAKQINDIYSNLPAPKPSVVTSRTIRVSNMSSFNNRDNGCFDGDGIVEVLRHNNFSISKLSIKVKDLKPGDYVETGFDNKYAKILCIITQDVDNIKMCHTGSLYITPWHPIYLEDQWVFPTDIYIEKNYTGRIYNLVLDTIHSVVISDVCCITLGHGIQNDPVASHPYFGTDAIIDELSTLPGWSDGFVNITDYSFVRDLSTNLICGLCSTKE
jgi:hypothetical protein